MTLLRALIVWVAMLVLAILNGAARDLLYLHTLGEPRSQQLSVLLAAILFFSLTWLVSRRWPFISPHQALALGALWVALTVAFEFIMVLVVQGKPLETALAQYDLAGGNLWCGLLLALFLAPLAVWWFRRRGRVL